MEVIEFSANQVGELKNVGSIISTLVQRQEQLTAEVEHLVKTNQTISHNCEVLQSRCQEYVNKLELTNQEKTMLEQEFQVMKNRVMMLEQHNETLKKQNHSLQNEKDDAIKERQSLAHQVETASISGARRGSIGGLSQAGSVIGGLGGRGGGSVIGGLGGSIVAPQSNGLNGLTSGLRTPNFLKTGPMGGVGLGASSAFRPLSAMSNASMASNGEQQNARPRPNSAISDTDSFKEQRERLRGLITGLPRKAFPDTQLPSHLETPGRTESEEENAEILGRYRREKQTPGGPDRPERPASPQGGSGDGLDQYNSMLDTRLQQMRQQLEQARREYQDLQTMGDEPEPKAGQLSAPTSADNLPDLPPPPFDVKAGYANERSGGGSGARADADRHASVTKLADSILNGTFNGPTSMATILENPNPSRRRRRRNSAEALPSRLPSHIPPPPVQAGGLGGAFQSQDGLLRGREFRNKRSLSSPNLGFTSRGPQMGPESAASHLRLTSAAAALDSRVSATNPSEMGSF